MKNVAAFQKTWQTTGRWLDAIAHSMGSTDTERAYHVLRSVLHAVRDRLPPEEAVHFAAQLPMLVRGFYFEGWHMADKPLRYRHKEDLLERIAKDLPALDPSQRESAVTAVFEVLEREISEGETQKLKHALPKPIRELWPTAA